MDTIIVKHLTKHYTIHHEKPTLVEKFVRNRDETFAALSDVSFHIKKGEKVGIVGPNGSGKTTLLKLIAHISSPTRGIVQTQGRVVSLIDLGAGFHPDLTGHQNIYLNGMLLGMRKKDIESKIQDIINFADIKQFIDAPLFTYSSGMALRLGFSIAIHADPDILLLDEHLSAGDANFQKKVEKRLKDLFKKDKTIILVTHHLGVIQRNCDRVIWLANGKIRGDGGVELLGRYDPAWKTRLY